jgi:hypothetical protein
LKPGCRRIEKGNVSIDIGAKDVFWWADYIQKMQNLWVRKLVAFMGAD